MLCVAYLHICSHEYVYTCNTFAFGGKRLMSMHIPSCFSTLFIYFLTYLLKAGSLSKPEAFHFGSIVLPERPLGSSLLCRLAPGL